MRRGLESVFCTVATYLTLVSGCHADRWHCRSDTVSEWKILPDGSGAPQQESLVNLFDIDLMGRNSFASLISKTYGEQSIDLKLFMADCAAHSQDGKCDFIVNLISTDPEQVLQFPRPYILPDEEIVKITGNNNSISSLSVAVSDRSGFQNVTFPFLLTLKPDYQLWKFSIIWQSLFTPKEVDILNIQGPPATKFVADTMSFLIAGACTQVP